MHTHLHSSNAIENRSELWSQHVSLAFRGIDFLAIVGILYRIVQRDELQHLLVDYVCHSAGIENQFFEGFPVRDFRFITIDVVLREWTHWCAALTLHCVRSEESDSIAFHVDPFVPSRTPTIVVHEDFHIVFVDFYHLCFQPLVHGVFHVYPLSNLKFSTLDIEWFQIP